MPGSRVPFFFFTDPATTAIYTLSLHDALPIYFLLEPGLDPGRVTQLVEVLQRRLRTLPDRKSTRLNSSHLGISYAVFCLKKKKTQDKILANDTSKHGQEEYRMTSTKQDSPVPT